MKNRVLYYPYVRVPDSLWLTRLLLYWDSVGTIVPYEFLEEPERLGEHTRSLVQNGLVTQVFPGAHLWNLPDFESSFLQYIDSQERELTLRKARFEKEQTKLIYAEKLQGLAEELAERKLAKEDKGPFRYQVEVATADDFMCYLAAVLGELEDVNATPVSDDAECLKRFAPRHSAKESQLDVELSDVRSELLEDVFPAPSRPLRAQEIAEFKGKHLQLLTRMRRTVEREVLATVDLRDKRLRERRRQLFRDEVSEDTAELRARLQESGFGPPVLGKLVSIVAAVPGVSSVFGLVSAVWSAFGDKPNHLGESPLAYAAHYQEEFTEI